MRLQEKWVVCSFSGSVVHRRVRFAVKLFHSCQLTLLFLHKKYFGLKVTEKTSTFVVRWLHVRSERDKFVILVVFSKLWFSLGSLSSALQLLKWREVTGRKANGGWTASTFSCIFLLCLYCWELSGTFAKFSDKIFCSSVWALHLLRQIRMLRFFSLQSRWLNSGTAAER